jgi:hypothetical protein
MTRFKVQTSVKPPFQPRRTRRSNSRKGARIGATQREPGELWRRTVLGF